MKYPKYFFLELEGVYVSDYIKFCPNALSHMPILQKICLSHDIHVLGHIPENKKNGSYAHFPEKFPENAKIIYVGQANHITGQKDSRFAVSNKDMAWKTQIKDV